jgi:hypothetical protein
MIVHPLRDFWNRIRLLGHVTLLVSPQIGLIECLHYVQQVRAALMMLLPCTSGHMGTIGMR